MKSRVKVAAVRAENSSNLIASLLLAVALLLMCFVTQSSAKEMFTGADIGNGEYSLKPDATQVYKTVMHEGKPVELRIQTFYPKGHQPSDKRAAAVFYHGGGWHSGTPDQFYPQCRHLALRGMVTFSVEYRTIKRFKNSPKECVKDGISAMRWLRKNAAQFGVDPERMAAGGGSAGGHIASAVAFCDAFQEDGEDQSVSPVPNALLLYNPVFDNGPGGFAHGMVKDYWEDISPAHNIGENPPPTIIISGSKDALLPVSILERYTAKMKEFGGRCELKVYQDREHGFFNIWLSRDDLVRTTLDVDAFLVSLGYLEGPALLEKPVEKK